MVIGPAGPSKPRHPPPLKTGIRSQDLKVLLSMGDSSPCRVTRMIVTKESSTKDPSWIRAVPAQIRPESFAPDSFAPCHPGYLHRVLGGSFPGTGRIRRSVPLTLARWFTRIWITPDPERSAWETVPLLLLPPRVQLARGPRFVVEERTLCG